MAANGTFTRNTDGHAKLSSSQPPSRGPATIPIAEMEPQAAMAFGRSSASNTWAMIESVAGITNAAPRPMNARSAISWSAPFTSGARAEPAPKSARPISNITLRP